MPYLLSNLGNIISSLEHPAFTAISLLIHNDIIFMLLLVFLALLFERRTEKIKRIFLALFLGFIIASSLKHFIHSPRPCMISAGAETWHPSKIPCPEGYSFPSMHATLAFILMLAFINKPPYPVFWFFAVFVAFSRIYLGVHSLEDIGAGLVLSPIVYFIVGYMEVFYVSGKK